LELLTHQKSIRGSAAMITCEEAEASVLHELRLSKLKPQQDDDGQGPEAENLDQAYSRSRERCRQAARRLAEKAEIVITQDGKVVDPSFAKGVMELKFPDYKAS
jgi:hypothetical protein